MTARFVLDEWSLSKAAEAELVELSDAIDRMIDRIDVARRRNEGIVKHRNYYDAELGGGLSLYCVLFEDSCSLRLDAESKKRLRLALDRTAEFDGANPEQERLEINGFSCRSPGMAWAHSQAVEGRQVAVLPLSLDGVPVGRAQVTVNGITHEIAFVADDEQHLKFFRDVIELENANEAMFERLAGSAFPALEWADEIWRELRDFSRPYINIRKELVRALSGLNDHGARCFLELGAGDPRHLQQTLSIRVGVAASDENGATKKHRLAERDRTRCHRGKNKVFWWHLKLQPHKDRIHFLYEPPPPGAGGSEAGCMVVGLFKDHCVLPK